MAENGAGKPDLHVRLLNDKGVSAAIDDLVDSLINHQSWSKKLGLHSNFIPGLLNEPSDWAFTLKAAAIAEALVNELIDIQIGDDQRQLYRPKDDAPIEQRGIGVPTQRKSGITTIQVANYSVIADKIDLCEHMGWMEPSWVASTRALMKIRNRYAHNIRLVNKRLTFIIANRIPENERADVFDAMLHAYLMEDRKKLNAALNVNGPTELNCLSKTRPLQKLESGSITEIIKGYEDHGCSRNEINKMLRSGALLSLTMIASTIDYTHQAISDAALD